MATVEIDWYALGTLQAEAADANAVVVLQAAPHQWGEGKAHIFSGAETTRCGKSISETPGSFRVGDIDEITCRLCIRSLEAVINADARREQWERQNEEWKERKREKDRQWHAWYDEYLRSDEWKQRRHQVLQRAGGMCEGCLKRSATQVHHLTYDRVGKEMLFDLVAICDICHGQIHE